MRWWKSTIGWAYVGLIGVNVWVAFILPVVADLWKTHWNEVLPGDSLPTFTVITLRSAYIWPGIAILLSLAGNLLAFNQRTSETVLWCLLVGVSLVEIVIVVMQMIAYVLPTVTMDYGIG